MKVAVKLAGALGRFLCLALLASCTHKRAKARDVGFGMLADEFGERLVACKHLI